MSRRFIKRLSNVPPHVAIILALVGIVGISGAVLLFKHSEPKAEAMVIPRAARLERVDGHVAIAQALNHADNDQLAWQDAVVNAPLTVGDRVWARDNSYAQIAFTGRNYARLNPGTALDVLTLADQRTQLALRSGSALFDVGYLPDGELYEVATPCGAVDFTEPGLYQLGIGDDGNATISVLSGLAQVVGLAGSGEISKGEVLTLVSQVAAQAVTSRLAPDIAGNILDDYYGYRYPNRYDGRYRNYDAYLDDPDYYDPYSHSTAYQYLDEEIPGLYDLDEYGDWQDVDGYGRCWAPRVAADWSPYRTGYWDTYDVWGPTWVSSEPWGYAPYHYGRWAYVSQERWVWVPEDCRRNAAYAPALVAFIPMQQSEIAWVPLAPGERYMPRYYDASFEPQYLASPQVVEQYVSVRNYANLTYPAAVTAVPVQAFTGPINQNVIVPVSPQWIQQAQPVIDPYQVEGVRNVALQQERWQRKQARRETDAAAFNRPVVTSVAPVVPPVQSNVAAAWQVQAVPEKQKRNKLRVENSGQVVAAQRPDGVPVVAGQPAQQAFAQQRDQRIAELKARQQQGDRSATQELRQLKQERKQAAQAQPQPQVGAQQQAPQGMTAKQQRRFERQQQAAQQQPTWAQQRQAAQQAQQAMTQKQQRRLERQQQMAQQQQAAGQQAQVNQQHAQRRAQKEAARQQMMQQQQQQRVQQQAAQQAQSKAQRRAERQQQQQMMQQQQYQQQQNQMKAQRRAERQQQAVMQQRQAAQAQAAQQQQMKQQMRMQRQQAAQQQMMQQQAAQQQMKAQRRAERQQQQQQQMVMQRQQQQVMQQQQMRQQEKQQRRYERQQQAQPQPQQRPQVFQGPPAQQQSKAERKAARRNQ